MVVMGTISSSNQPAFWATSARRKLSTAYSSCCRREMLKSLPTFSEVWIMGCLQSAASWLASISGEKTVLSPVAFDMLSPPSAMPMSMLPVVIWLAMSCTALSPDEQNRFTALAPEVCGKPAASMAARTLYAAPMSPTFPRQMSSTSEGSILLFSTNCFNRE